MVHFWVNGEEIHSQAPEDLSLLRFLRDHRRLVGTKDGCSQGHCGTCTVILDGKAAKACLLKLGNMAGKRVETIEGLSRGGFRHPLQQAFMVKGAVQCGFCTPGVIMAAKALLDRNPSPSVADIKKALTGNLCRCTGYVKMVEAVQAAAAIMRSASPQIPDARDEETAVIGRSVTRKDDHLRVTGQLKFADDLYLDDMLYGKILWSQYPHAEIVSMDMAKARSMPGVHSVLTAADVPPPNRLVPPTGSSELSPPLLADKKVRFTGEPVALVLAKTPEEAEAACSAIQVEYRELPGVFSPVQAMAADAPYIHDSGNVFEHIPFHKGDVARGFAQAEVVVEGDYSVPRIEHGYLEPEAGVAVPQDGGVTLWVSTQWPTQHRDIIAKALGLPTERVRLAKVACGGGFGGKLSMTIHPLLALAALRSQKPVKIVLSRVESLRIHPKRCSCYLHYKTGATREGRLTAVEASFVMDSGAYGQSNHLVFLTGVIFGGGPYVVPNYKMDARTVATNQVPSGAMRGFGSIITSFAVESQMDMLARKLHMDPLEFRLRNAVDVGSIAASGQVLGPGTGVKEVLNQIKWAWEGLTPAIPSQPHRKIGVGTALAWKNAVGTGAFGDREATLQVTEGGRILLRVSCPDIGQGSDTVLAQIAAQTLGVSYDLIDVLSGDTHQTPASGGTSGQSVTMTVGNAVVEAARLLKAQLTAYVARQLGVVEGQVSIERDRFVDGDKVLITLSALARLALSEGEQFQVIGTYTIPKKTPLSLTGNTDGAIDPKEYRTHYCFPACANIAVVEVDERTGETKVLKVIAVHDVGKALNPRNIESHVHGSVALGLGLALKEEFLIEKGYNVTDSLKKYGMPTIADIPDIDIHLVEVPEPEGPFGAKGMAESAALAVAPAIINAIYDATGVRLHHLPVTRERLKEALKQKVLLA
ncbi:MAG: molybdopterin-dependent oxidoreductase [Chloroflexi bacterium]|nr:molybdopterin-dependent oxidoreductase [Chloroflexota bacterium]